MFGDGAPTTANPPANCMVQLHASGIGRVDDLYCDGRRTERGPRWEASQFHFLLPIAGGFIWHVGREDILVDPNQALYVSGDQEFAFSHPLGAERSLVITPKRAIIDELAGKNPHWSGSRVRSGSRSVLAAYDVQLAVHRLRKASGGQVDPLDMDELLIEAMRGLSGLAPVSSPAIAGSAKRTIERAKAYLHVHSAEPISLSSVAAATGVSPVYLTYLFRCAEGVPLYQYLLKLRLAAALAELPACEDITGLALDVGFSSHSHFSAAFRSKFGMSPSRFREELIGSEVPNFPADRILAAPRSDRNLIVFPLCDARGGGGSIDGTAH